VEHANCSVVTIKEHSEEKDARASEKDIRSLMEQLEPQWKSQTKAPEWPVEEAIVNYSL
jgi:hypothetical protein